MARLNVNPTRMEMTRLKGQLKTATRGHKLLKDKLDELMKQFMDIVRENKRLREEAESALENAYQNFIIARAVLSEASLGEALMIPQQAVAVKVTNRNIMSVNVPVFDFQKESGSEGNIYPYGMAFTSRSWTARCFPSPMPWSLCSVWRKVKNPHSCWRRRSNVPAVV